MAGLIHPDDIAAVKERASIEDVVREHVTLRPAGVGSSKGLCPFHDEKTPSFTIRPAMGYYHCFGCGESGDVISFIQKVEHLTFADAVERLAGGLGMELRRTEGTGRSEMSLSGRSRLIEAHRVAQEYYEEHLRDLGNQRARVARDFLRSRDFNGEAAARFGVGFAPMGFDELSRHLTGKGFTEDELVTSGLAGRGQRGLYDRFRGRLVWPIHNPAGDVVGFGARRLFDDDRIEAKYLNTAETPIYKKSQVLYGLDLARKAMAKERVAVIVEGYTDVMAAHLSGVETAVATCGTAFGVDHIKILRRIVRDEEGMSPARVVFTFDGDAAGQKAAMKAFAEDQRWAAQSYVAVAPDGMDPCDLRKAKGPEAVQALVADATPMFEFAVRTTLARFDLTSPEGRVAAARAVAPMVSTVRDPGLRPEYTREVAGWLGIDITQMQGEVARAARSPRPAPGSRQEQASSAYPGADAGSPTIGAPDLRDPLVHAERQLLQVLIQYPGMVDPSAIQGIPVEAFVAPAHRAVFEALRSVTFDDSRPLTAWLELIRAAAPLVVHDYLSELAVADLPSALDENTGRPQRRYVEALLSRVHEVALTRSISDLMVRVRQVDTGGENDPDETRELYAELQALQRTLATLRETTAGR
ncbi:MAG: DNA primase [Dermatophilaceae bacterium]|nr:DNA primase [Intrasporangiaceae bacterium]